MIILESFIDTEKDRLSPDVWDYDEKSGNYSLNFDVKYDILSLLDDIIDIGYLDRIVISGSITTNYYTKESDVDVTVFLTNNVQDDELLTYRDYALQINETKFAGKHPINFYFRNDSLDELGEDYSDGIYDILSDSWIKKFKGIDDLWNVLKTPRELAYHIASQYDEALDDVETELKNVVNVITDNQRWQWKNGNIEYHRKNMPKGQLMDAIASLQVEMDEYIEMAGSIVKKRTKTFKDELSKNNLEIVKKYGSRNLLPYPIIYKYLTEWLYMKFLHLFQKILIDDRIDVPKEVQKLWKEFNSAFDL